MGSEEFMLVASFSVAPRSLAPKLCATTRDYAGRLASYTSSRIQLESASGESTRTHSSQTNARLFPNFQPCEIRGAHHWTEWIRGKIEGSNKRASQWAGSQQKQSIAFQFLRHSFVLDSIGFGVLMCIPSNSSRGWWNGPQSGRTEFFTMFVLRSYISG